MKEEALKLADRADNLAIELPADWSSGEPKNVMTDISAMIRRLVEELDRQEQGLVEASAMLFNYKYELDLERAMSAQLKEELDKHK